MTKAHKIKLNPTPEQEQYFYRAAGVARFAWNWSLAEYKRRKEAGEKIDWNDIKKEFREQARIESSFVFEVTKCAAEQAINDLRQAINTYYKSKKTNQKSKIKFPRNRKRSKKIGGFGLNNDKFSTQDHEVRVPKLGSVNMTEKVRFNGKILSGRIKEQYGSWFLIVTVQRVEVESIQAQARPLRSVGIDPGLKTYAVLSDGEQSETQAYYRQSEDRLKRLQRGLARKKKGSKNRARWKRKIARAHARVANLRHDHMHKFTRQVVNKFDIICVEDLSLKGLTQTRLAKSFHDAGIGTMMKVLEHKVKEKGGYFQPVDRFFPSTKRCHACGYINNELTLSDREWICPQCGTDHQRDLNSAINLELEGVSLLAGSGSIGATTVEFAANTLKAISKQVVDCEAVRINCGHLST